MQRIDRGVEIAVFLLQPCELGLEFALIFVGHGLLNQNADEICESSCKLIHNYPPWQPAPQARSIRTNKRLRGFRALRPIVNAGQRGSWDCRVPIIVQMRFGFARNGYPAVAKGLRASRSRFVTATGEI